ncbi:MAG: hypothetical protein ACE5FF_11840 [Saprospiraceae bacterium]
MQAFFRNARLQYLCRPTIVEQLMITYTKHSLQKLEALLTELGYIIRYEKGSFNSGYCLVEDRKIAVINKFFDVEARIGVLLDILSIVDFDEGILSEKSAKFYRKIQVSSGGGEGEL